MKEQTAQIESQNPTRPKGLGKLTEQIILEGCDPKRFQTGSRFPATWDYVRANTVQENGNNAAASPKTGNSESCGSLQTLAMKPKKLKIVVTER